MCKHVSFERLAWSRPAGEMAAGCMPARRQRLNWNGSLSGAPRSD